jgi:lipoprotein-anchoring transpeptidase ErfK/SrfK
MQRSIAIVFILSILSLTAAGGAAAQQQMSSAPPGYGMPTTPRMVVAAAPPAMQARLGGGFIEFLFGGNSARAAAMQPAPLAGVVALPNAVPDRRPIYANTAPDADASLAPQQVLPDGMDPRYLRQEVDYRTTEKPGTIVIDTPNKFLYLVEDNGKALRYGIGVGRPGFTWSGEHEISAKKEWPDWVPPAEMIERQPYLPRFMPGGPNNPLGARAMYLGSTLYRIHGSNEPWTIGHNVSSGCIRLRNADVIDLYGRVKVGTKVVVM